jgi:hypothetical protein
VEANTDCFTDFRLKGIGPLVGDSLEIMGLPPLKKLTIAKETSINSAPNLLLVLHATIESFSDWRPIFNVPGSTPFSQLTQLDIVAYDRAASFNILSSMPRLMPVVKRVTIAQQDFGYTLIVARSVDLTSCVQLEQLELAVNLLRDDRILFPPSLIVLRLGTLAEAFRGLVESPPLPRLKELAFSSVEAGWYYHLERLLKSDGVGLGLRMCCRSCMLTKRRTLTRLQL